MPFSKGLPHAFLSRNASPPQVSNPDGDRVGLNPKGLDPEAEFEAEYEAELEADWDPELHPELHPELRTEMHTDLHTALHIHSVYEGLQTRRHLLTPCGSRRRPHGRSIID